MKRNDSLKRMNGDSMYKRIKKYADESWKDYVVLDWNYKTTGDKEDFCYGLVKVVELTQTLMSYSGYTLVLKSIINVPYDGRRKVIFDKIME